MPPLYRVGGSDGDDGSDGDNGSDGDDGSDGDNGNRTSKCRCYTG